MGASVMSKPQFAAAQKSLKIKTAFFKLSICLRNLHQEFVILVIS